MIMTQINSLERDIKKESTLTTELILRDPIYVFYTEKLSSSILLKSPKSTTPLHDELCKYDEHILYLIDFLLTLTEKTADYKGKVRNKLWVDGFISKFTVVNKKTKKI